MILVKCSFMRIASAAGNAHAPRPPLGLAQARKAIAIARRAFEEAGQREPEKADTVEKQTP